MRTSSLLLSLACLLCAPVTHAQALLFDWAGGMGSNEQDEGRGIATDAAGNVYTTGIFENTWDSDPGPDVHPLVSAGIKDVFISKLDPSGTYVWAKRIGGPAEDYANAIATDAEGHVYITGYFAGTVDFDPGDSTYLLSSTGGYNDAFILKLDAAGAFVWAQRIGATNPDYGYGITVDRSGHVLVTGGLLQACDVDNGSGTLMLDPGIFVLKLDSDGNLLWGKQMGQYGDNGLAIAADTSGNVYTTGTFAAAGDFDPGPDTLTLTAEGLGDIFVSKLDPDGALVWAAQMGGTQADEGHAIAVDHAGNVFITGAFRGTCDFDPGSASYPLTAAGVWDAFTAKLDASGAFVWAFALGGNSFGNTDVGFGVAVDTLGNVYTTGNFLGNVDFDPGPATFFLNSGSRSDIFIHSVTTDGQFNWAGQIGSGTFNYNSGNAIHVDGGGHGLVTGSFVSTGVDFDPGGGEALLSSSGGYDAFVLAFSSDLPTGTDADPAVASSIHLFPDPTTGSFTVRLQQIVPNARIVLYDPAGRVAYTEALPGLDNRLNAAGLAAGVYSYRVFADHAMLGRGALVMEQH